MKGLAGLVLAAAVAGIGTGSMVAPTDVRAESVVDKGKAIALNRKKGNCVSCHAFKGGSLPGNAGPPLVAMKARFPDKAVLRAQIHDPTKRNPQTLMPPFGLHKILTEKELDAVVEWVYTL